MKNFTLQLKWLMLTCLLSIGANAWADNYVGTFNIIRSVDDFTTGYYVVTASETSSSPLALGTVVDSNKRMTGQNVTIVAKETIIDPSEDIVWYIEVTGTQCTMKNVSTQTYLYQANTTSGKGMGLTNTPTNIQLDGYNDASPIGFKFGLNGASNNKFMYNNSSKWFANYGSDYSTSMLPVALYKLETSNLEPQEADLSEYDGKTIEVVYGETHTVNITKAGALTLESENTAIATVDGSVITPQAVGTTTITIKAEANNFYKEAEASFTLKVMAPNAMQAQDEITFTSGTEIGSTTVNGTPDSMTKNGITISSDDAAFATAEYRFYANSTTTISTNQGKIIKIEFEGNGTDSSNSLVNLTVKDGNGVYEATTAKAGTWTGNAESVVFAAGKQARATKVTVTIKLSTTTVTLAKSGYASYCSAYPLDFSDAEGFAAYYVSDVNDTEVTFTKITGVIAGGVPFILYGESDADCQLQYAEEAGETFESNMLVGTLAPTYVTTEENGATNYGLKDGNFLKINPGVVPANKAYLQVKDVNAAALRIVFADGEATAIEAVESAAKNDGVYYNIAGQRVQTPTSGIYIVNGKKVLVK